MVGSLSEREIEQQLIVLNWGVDLGLTLSVNQSPYILVISGVNVMPDWNLGARPPSDNLIQVFED